MISFDNGFFFSKNGLDFKNNRKYIKNLNLSKIKAAEILEEFSEGKNQILQSFTSKYQKGIRELNETVKFKDKKKVIIGIGGSSSGAKALSFFLNDKTIYFYNLDY